MRAHVSEVELEDAQLSWLCIKPMLMSVRAKSMESKLEVYQQLNEGQRALYLFYAFHNHVNTVYEFYWFATDYISELKAWPGLKAGARFFENAELLIQLERIEAIITQKKRDEHGQWQAAAPSDLESDLGFSEVMSTFFNDYHHSARAAILQMNAYIIGNKEDFIQIEG